MVPEVCHGGRFLMCVVCLTDGGGIGSVGRGGVDAGH